MDAAESTLTDREIEGVARCMCGKMGLDPESMVTIEGYSDYTPWEARYVNFHPQAQRTYQPPIVGAPPYEDASSKFTPPIVTVPRWRTFRREAAIALAGWRAVHHYMLAGDA